MSGRNRARTAGFTLLEVLVAFIIAALALGVMFDGVLAGMRSSKVAADTERAVAMARSRLAAVQVAVASGAARTMAEQEGDEGDGFHFSVRVRPAAGVTLAPDPDAPTGPGIAPPRATLYAISVAISWAGDGATRQVRLDGAKLVMTAPSG
jgi:general secretion pathway protein I